MSHLYQQDIQIPLFSRPFPYFTSFRYPYSIHFLVFCHNIVHMSQTYLCGCVYIICLGDISYVIRFWDVGEYTHPACGSTARVGWWCHPLSSWQGRESISTSIAARSIDFMFLNVFTLWGRRVWFAFSRRLAEKWSLIRSETRNTADCH